MKKTKVGIIGLGIGRWHLDGYLALPDAEVVALCDSDEKRLAETAAKHGIRKCYAEAQGILSDPGVEALSVCLPNNLHAPVTVAALEGGKHVLCEKPLADTVENARRIVAAAGKSGLVCQVGMKFRFLPEARYLDRLREKGAMGDLYYGYTHYLRPPDGIPGGAGRWFTSRAAAGGGALIDNGVHLLDLNWFLMGRPRPVAAYGFTGTWFGHRPGEKRAGFDVEDFGCGLVRFADGAAIYLDNAWAAMVEDTVIGLRICGSAGGATMWPFSVVSGKDSRAAGEVPDLSGEPCPDQFRHFIDCVRGRASTISPAADGLTVLEMIDAVYRSAATGRLAPIGAGKTV